MQAGASKKGASLDARAKGASIAEFGPVLVIFILIILVPLTNMLFYAAGYSLVASLSQGCATDAANSATFSEALTNVEKRSKATVESGFGQFVKLKPVGGYNGSGVDLYIATMDLANPNMGQLIGPNKGLPAGTQTDAAKTVYQYTVRTSFGVGPCMDLGGLPLLGSLPMVGQPASVTVESSRTAEHIDCLTIEKK